MDTTSFDDIKNEWIEEGQGHVFQWYDKLSTEDKINFEKDIRKINIKEVTRDYKKVIHDKVEQKLILSYQHFENVMTLNKIKEQDKKRWEQIGYELIGKGEVGILLLAGGQATRLGTTFPKGFYDVGLPSKKSLFQLQAERVNKLQQLVNQHYPNYDENKPIQWYIMTSEATHNETIKYFERYNYFGLRKESFFFFSQQMIPCITPEGKVISESASKISLSPNGNGGLFKALSTSGAIDDMRKKGIKYISQYCVDNILIKMADPIFMGYMHEQSADCAAKVVSKNDPEEPVGVMAIRENKPFVLEYSEIDKESKYMKDENGELVFNYAHICINAFSFEFLDRIAKQHLDDLKYHVAYKKIPSADANGVRVTPSSPNGWKLEKFIFDVFPLSTKMVCMEINRSHEFSPLKNCAGMPIPADSPETCLRDICHLHRVFIEEAGGKVDIEDSLLCEVSPLTSYFGEGLEHIVKGKTFKLPLEINPHFTTSNLNSTNTTTSTTTTTHN